MERHGDVVWRVCLMRLGQRSDAQDAFQETFLRYALHDEVSFEDEGHERAWLVRVATNHCLDVLRSSARSTERLDDSFEETPSIELSDDPSAALWEVAQELDKLPGNQREAVYLTICEGYAATEVAAMMDVPVNTVYSWVARGKKQLKEALG